MIDIEILGSEYPYPSSAADENWAARQVVVTQALAEGVNDNADDVGTLETDLTALSAAVKPSGVVGTAGSGTGISASSTNYGRHVVHKITVGHAAVAAAAGASTTGDVVLWTLPAKTRVLRVIADITATFTGGSISGVAMVCGNTAGGNAYLLTGSVLAGTATRGLLQSTLGSGINGGTGFFSDFTAPWTNTTTVQARFTGTGDNLDQLTTGSVTFYIEACTYP